jgi:hypothetical protein
MPQDPADSWLLAACADPRRDLWGLIFGSGEPRAVLRRIDASAAAPRGEIYTGDPDQTTPVQLTPADESVGPVAATERASEAIAIVRVSGAGATSLDEEPLELDAPAFGFVGRSALAKLDSVRIVAAWFPSDRAVGLAAFRPRGGHADKDVVTVLVTGEPEPQQVFDPRLSTTYDAGGAPLRAGLELWLGADEDGDQRPLRVASESTGGRFSAELGELHLEAYPQRCHNRGEDGVGVYALLRPR